MRAEIIAVGTELLIGQIVNTNAQYLSRQFADMGVNVYYQTVVGDNAGRLADALRIAAGRADLVVCTGGLGPTSDDITKEVLADLVGAPLAVHEPTLEKISAYFRERRMRMSANNKRQAMMIQGGEALLNDTGMAVGVAMTAGGVHYILLPGPPRELAPMFESYAKPWILARMPEKAALHSRMLKFAGIGESALEEALIDLIEGQTDPTIAPYAKEGEVTIRLTTRASAPEEAAGKLDQLERIIRERVGEYLYADEDIPLEEALVRLMSARGLTLSLAESCTGGLFGERITSVPGSSAMFAGAEICYSNEWKRRELAVPAELLEGEEAPGAVSEETAVAMAEGLLRRAGTDYTVAITGVAGPAHSERKPVGLVYVALASKRGKTEAHRLNLHGNRGLIRLRAVKRAMYLLWKRVKTEHPG